MITRKKKNQLLNEIIIERRCIMVYHLKNEGTARKLLL